MTRARSWLFAPGDSERKMAKAIEGEADRVILDLEDSVAPEAKAGARTLVRAALRDVSDRARVWVRINPLDGEYALADLAAIMPVAPSGIVLPKANGRGDVERLDHYLSALEVANDLECGSTKVLPLVTETAAAMFTTGDYVGAPRLAGLTWGAEDLADALGASENTGADGTYLHTFELARSLCLLGAVSAGVQPVETIMADFRDTEGLKTRAEMVWRAGYRGMLAIHPAQIPIINAAFTPGEAEIAEARKVVELFEANPGAGTVGREGKMYDRPHLDRARALLALSGK